MNYSEPWLDYKIWSNSCIYTHTETCTCIKQDFSCMGSTRLEVGRRRDWFRVWSFGSVSGPLITILSFVHPLSEAPHPSLLPFSSHLLSLFMPAKLVNTRVCLVPPHVTMKKDTDSQLGVRWSRDSLYCGKLRKQILYRFNKKLRLVTVES